MINISKINGIKGNLVKLDGTIDRDGGRELVLYILKMIRNENVDVFLDFTNLTFMNSVGIGSLSKIYIEIKKLSLSLYLMNLQPAIFEMLTRTNIGNFFSDEMLAISDTELDYFN